MFERIRERLIWREPLQRFEMVSPLPVEQCMMRLTGRHPPFRDRERFARSLPFRGEIHDRTVSIKVGPEFGPYELFGDFSEDEGGTRFHLALSVVDRQAMVPFGLAGFWINVAVWCMLIPIVRGTGPYIMAAFILFSLSFPTFWSLRYAFGLRRRAPDAVRQGAPDITDTVQVLANLLLATDVEGISAVSSPKSARTSTGQEASE